MTCVSVSCSLVLYQQGSRESLIERVAFCPSHSEGGPLVGVKNGLAQVGLLERKSIRVPAFIAWPEYAKLCFVKPCHMCIQSPSIPRWQAIRVDVSSVQVWASLGLGLGLCHTIYVPSVLPISGPLTVPSNLGGLRTRCYGYLR